MFSKYAAAALAATAPLTALAAPTQSCPDDPGFNWQPCEFEGEVESAFRYECSNFTVPLDYLDESSNKTLQLQVTRVPAVNGESLGSIFFNFGGPGFEARNSLAYQANEIMTVTEGRFDLVSWDPRGVANTMPFKCFNDTERAEIMPKLQLVEEVAGLEDKPRLARMWASMGNFATNCLTTDENAPEIGELIGTGYVARDLMRLKDALDGPDAMLNYWGISYGTVLGATVAAMYPDKMGRVLLDGNANIPQWYNGYDTLWFQDADKAVWDFFDRCVKSGPERCALAGRNESADVLNDKMYQLMHELQLSPIPLGGASILDTSAFKVALRIILYGRQPWPLFAAGLDELYKPADERNMTAISELWIPMGQATDITASMVDESAWGIFCSDKNARADSFEEMLAVTEEALPVSKSLGELNLIISYPCARWPFHAKGAYVSDWTTPIKTKNPILFTGTRYDPVTSIQNAHNGSRIFEGAGVFTHGGIGHGISQQPSLCTAKTVRAYFHNGTMPDKDLECSPDIDAFDLTKTWVDVYLPELDWE